MSPEPTRLARTLAVIEEGRRDGLHLGAQLYASLRGETVAELAVGEDRPGEPLTGDALMLWMSSTKPVTAIAVAMLWERGLLALDDPIARHIPAFAAGGKEAITIRHALTHTGGFRMLDVGWPKLGWEETIARIAAARKEPRWVPGEKAGYHLASSWFILGELVQRASGIAFSDFVRREIFLPLGMEDCWIGMPEDRFRELAGRLATTWDTESDPPTPHGWESRERVTRPSPGGNGRGPVRQLARLYEMLLAGGERQGTRLLTPQSVEALVARHRVGLYDHTFRHLMDWGLGLIPDSKHYGDEVPYAYGRHASRRTYGHSGYRSSTAFADPEHSLVVALAFNATPADDAHSRRMRATVEAIYEDLGLADGQEGAGAAPQRTTGSGSSSR